MNQTEDALSSVEKELFKRLFTEDIPLLDVRAPIEFKKGAFPNAVNLPILDDDEREQVGLCYKQDGPDAAVELGHKLVSGATKQARIDAWSNQIKHAPNTHLYCFRGGQRSQLTESWLAAIGIEVERIGGGYKDLRNFLLQQFEDLPPLVVIAGKTGTGKTELLVHAPHMVDLEGRANHRGSAFGATLTPQPSQIDFENLIAIDFLKLSGKTVFLEDEGRLIGGVSLPLELQARMKEVPLYLLEDSLENRVARIHKDYIVSPQAGLVQKGIDVVEYLSERYQNALVSIKRRLGGQRQTELAEIMANAFDKQRQGDDSLHKEWISVLLTDYYDPMYEYQLEKKQDRIIKRGDFAYLRSEMLKQ